MGVVVSPTVRAASSQVKQLPAVVVVVVIEVVVVVEVDVVEVVEPVVVLRIGFVEYRRTTFRISRNKICGENACTFRREYKRSSEVTGGYFGSNLVLFEEYDRKNGTHVVVVVGDVVVVVLEVDDVELVVVPVRSGDTTLNPPLINSSARNLP